MLAFNFNIEKNSIFTFISQKKMLQIKFRSIECIGILQQTWQLSIAFLSLLLIWIFIETNCISVRWTMNSIFISASLWSNWIQRKQLNKKDAKCYYEEKLWTRDCVIHSQYHNTVLFVFATLTYIFLHHFYLLFHVHRLMFFLPQHAIALFFIYVIRYD